MIYNTVKGQGKSSIPSSMKHTLQTMGWKDYKHAREEDCEVTLEDVNLIISKRLKLRDLFQIYGTEEPDPYAS